MLTSSPAPRPGDWGSSTPISAEQMIGALVLLPCTEYRLKILTMFLSVGEPAPWFSAESNINPLFHFSTVGGRYVILCFLNSSSDGVTQKMLEDLVRFQGAIDEPGQSWCFFAVSSDPEDKQQQRLTSSMPELRIFWDFDHKISRLYRVIDSEEVYHHCTYILDERLRVLGIIPFGEKPENHIPYLISILPKLPPIPLAGMAAPQAPVLVVPRIFESELCRKLIAYYHQHGGQESGFMREKDGKTIGIQDPTFKRRRDQTILDPDLRSTAMFRIHNRLTPEIQKAFQFQATRIERHIIACYESSNHGFFRPHRDNTTKGTAHRRFAVSVNLNTGEYEGGMLRFPEFGRQTYVAPAGGAVVFSCSLLHEATPVTAGRRYAYLPFLYDDAAAQIREQNLQFVASEGL
ncbi:MAG: 2OG-Fe(II) oxygenase [Limnospira sp.]